MSDEQDDILAAANDAAEEAFDLSDIDPISPGAWKAGRYLCRCVECKLEHPKDKEPKLVLRFKGINPKQGRPLFKHGNLKGKGVQFTAGLLAALGVDLKHNIRPSDVVDKLVYLTVTVREDRPTENNIAAWEAYDGGPIDGDDVSSAEELPNN